MFKIISIFIIVLFFSVNISFGEKVNNIYTQKKNFFIENLGQWDSSIKYRASVNGSVVYLTNNSIIIGNRKSGEEQTQENFGRQFFNISFIEAQTFEIKQKSKLKAYYNYFLGNDKNFWKNNVPLFTEIIAEDIYPGVALRLVFNEDSLSFDLIVSPGTNPDIIKLKVEGYENYSDSENNQSKQNNILTNRVLKSISASQRNYKSNAIDCKYQFIKDTLGDYLTFDLVDYDRTQTLIISPVFYSSFLGGEAWDVCEDIEVDKSGNIYVVGYTNSKNFPITDSAYSDKLRANNYNYPDIFVSKFDSSGNELIFSTFIGGVLDDFGKSIGIDNAANIYITGYTGQTQSFPVTDNAFDTLRNGGYDSFITKLNPLGSDLVYSTFIGSSNDDFAQALYVDNSGSAYIVGYTKANDDFPLTENAIQSVHAGMNDAFLTRINSLGDALIYSTYLGGSADDFGEDIAVGLGGSAYIIGMTRSVDFPVTSDAYDNTYNDTLNSVSQGDVFISKIHNTGNLSYSTFLGGSGKDIAYSIALDNSGAFYVTGVTESKDYPVTSYAYDTTYRSKQGTRTSGDIFVTKFNSSGNNLKYSTYIGGSSADRAYDIALDKYLNAYVLGSTSSFDLPVSQNAYDRTYNDSSFGADIIIAALDSSGSKLVYSTFFGGEDKDVAYAMKIVDDEIIYFVGTTSSTFYPLSENAHSSTYNNSEQSDGFISILQPNILNVDIGDDLLICEGISVRIGNPAYGARGSATYTWSPSVWLDNINSSQPIASPNENTTFTVFVIDDKGYRTTDTIIISLLPIAEAKIFGSQEVYTNSEQNYAAIPYKNVEFFWKVNGGEIISGDSTNFIRIKWIDSTQGSVSLITLNYNGCADTSDNYIVKIGKEFKPKIIPLDPTTFCDGDYCVLDGGEYFVEYSWSDGKMSRYDTVRTAGDYWVFVRDSAGRTAFSDTITIKVLTRPPKPEIEFIKDSAKLYCKLNGYDYRWYLNGDSIPESNFQEFEPISGGYYQCEIIDENGCTNISDSLYLSLVGNINDEKNMTNIAIFPNPNSGYFYISVEHNSDYILSINVYNILGNSLYRKTLKSQSKLFLEQINLSELTNGLYFIKIMINENIYFDKIQINK